MVGY
jgi:hypothetical protein